MAKLMEIFPNPTPFILAFIFGMGAGPDSKGAIFFTLMMAYAFSIGANIAKS